MQNTLRNKNLYKLFLIVIKYVPTILALFKITSLTLSYFEITSFAVTCIGGTSILFLILLCLIASIFRFCGLYRISLNYVSIVTAITVLDWYFNLPLNTASRYLIYAVITGVFVVTWVIYWYKNRNNPKIDHIKQLCDTYC